MDEFSDSGGGYVKWITNCIMDIGLLSHGMLKVVASINLGLLNERDENGIIGWRWLVKEGVNAISKVLG